MDDQFGGRTDDDLFLDDFEPVDGEAVVTSEPAAPSAREIAISELAEKDHRTAKEEAKSQAPPAAQKGLASSRYANKPSSPAAPATAAQSTPTPATATEKTSTSTTAQPSSEGPPSNAPTAPKEKPQRSNQNARVTHEARLQSGANPRQKLTEDELSVKMAQMKLLNAEKTRKFEKAEMDEKQHAEAYARGMEQARKRQVEADERRRRGEDNQRKLNDERAKNRERKLKAMGMKEGGWDEGKEAAAEEEARRGFKGANGGVRGARRGGLGGSRYARDDEEVPDVDRFLDDRQRGRGRGRGRGNTGRGGRGGQERTGERPTQTNNSVPTTEDFPSLPAGAAPKSGSDAATKPAIDSITLPKGGGGKWADDMEEFDEVKQKG